MIKNGTYRVYVRFNAKDMTEAIDAEQVDNLLYNVISMQKLKKLIENETINISGFKCIAVEDLEKLLGGANND